MTDISDLASLNFEDLAQADLFDLVTSSTSEMEDLEEIRSPSPPAVSCLDPTERYTSITLINGEQIRLREQAETDDYFFETGQDNMDLNSVLQAGVVERVVSSTSSFDTLEWEPEEKEMTARPSQAVLMSTVIKVDSAPAILSTLKPVSRPRATILASQLPLPIPANSRLLDRRQNTVIISSSDRIVQASELPQANNNNSLLRSALTNRAGSVVSEKTGLNQHVLSDKSNSGQLILSDRKGSGQMILSEKSSSGHLILAGKSGSGQIVLSDKSGSSQMVLSEKSNVGQFVLSDKSSMVMSDLKQGLKRTVVVKTEDRQMTDRQDRQMTDDILLLSMEGRDAVARLKDGASQLFPNTRVTSDRQTDNVISIEVDVSGNLVLHKSSSQTSPVCPISPGQRKTSSPLDLSEDSHLSKVRKYHRRGKEEPKKESRLLHYCHICNKGFKDKYSVNVHVRTHTGEKPFSCGQCGKCFRQKAHLAKHQQTHTVKTDGGTSNMLNVTTAVEDNKVI